MKRSRWAALTVVVLALLTAGLTLPALVRAYWGTRSSNAVRRGVERAGELGCFHCHGELGRAGLPDPAGGEDVPAWSGGVWMMYVRSDAEIRDYILNGRPAPDELAGGVEMPAYRDRLRGSDLADLIAAFKVTSGMSVPAEATPARRGYDLAHRWRCSYCHGVGGSGGLPNPGSFSGFIPGWYGDDFEELVQDRAEFDEWVLTGSSERLAADWIGGHFLERQQLKMPAYAELTPAELDQLWAYTRWLAETDGGHRGASTRF